MVEAFEACSECGCDKARQGNMNGETEPRADHELWCTLLEQNVFVLNNVCFGRRRSARCSFCKHDLEAATVKLIWHLCDWLEDRIEQERLLE